MKVQKTLWAAFALCLSALSSCYPEHAPSEGTPALTENGGNGNSGGSDGVGEAGASEGAVVCPSAVAQPLPARSEVMSADATPTAQRVFVKDLFSSFSANCGGCHVETNQGGFQNQKVTLQNFPMLVDQAAVDAILQTDPTKIMPPSSAPPSSRPATDPVLTLGVLLEKWIQAGRPSDSFFLEPDVASGISLLKLSTTVGLAMTNLGNCIPAPDKSVIASETDKSNALDTMFATATTLPVNLSDTDLFTLDSAELARYGVIAFAPAYPLWSDDAKKVRMVRVPRGQSITFDKTTQKFNIPANTRFYKTFLKQVVDVMGNVSFKKIETRLIVSRPDTCDAQGQNCVQNALYGTYAWDESETKADLVQDLLRDEQPFADRLITYITDEQKAATSKDPEADGLTRRYAIPGSTRCVQCHMGSVSQSFVLGFAPLQIRRRPTASAQISDGAVIEPTNTDELSQFQRLIDYGIITGATSEDDVVKLEESESVPPRNVYEVNAQGYMAGNCGHCHNPRGYPSIQHPELVDNLNFWPTMGGGIFQFPINRVSPRTFRGLSGEFAVPYITQSIDDTDYGDQVPTGVVNPGYAPKQMVMPADASGVNQILPVLAPWRSLIYRNVDTPFTYTEANAVFPHMPLNTPGYDCRVPQIMGDWMVSIPVQRVKQGPVGTDEILPYTESLPADTFYPQHAQEATERLAQYHASYRYNFCPDTSDIVDPEVVSGQVLTPQDNGYPLPGYTAAQVALSPVPQTLVFKDGIPDRPHWVITDPTENPGPWVPRRPDFGVALFGDPPAAGDTTTPESDDLQTVVQVVGQGTITFTDAFNQFALVQRPLAYWDPAPQGANTPAAIAACTSALANQPKASDLTGADRLPWLDAHRTPQWYPAGQTPGDSTPVYETSIGAQVFNEICINCHGPAADGKSALADTLLQLTGGTTRVADLRDGLFGPSDMPGDNRARVFGMEAAAHNLTTDDIAVRYVAFMGLGGTEKPIPDSILEQVANTPVFGEVRDWSENPPPATANMLATARSACRVVAPSNTPFDVTTGSWPEKFYFSTPLNGNSGDGDMWQLLCYEENPGPVFALEGDQWQAGSDPTLPWASFHLWGEHRFDRKSYPPNYPVGGAGGKVYPSLTDDNVLPWCVTPPGVEAIGVIPGADSVALYQGHVEDLWQNVLGRSDPIPYCPWVIGDLSQSFWDDGGRSDPSKQIPSGGDADNVWEIRGAANAGRAVFAYIDAVAKGTITPQPHYDQCYLLNSSGM